MNVLAICGSPVKNGNTSFLLKECLAGAQEAGATTQFVHLSALNYNGCRGCHACKRGNTCVIQDDLTPVLASLAAADAVILGSPLYGWCVAAQLKACMDRFYGFLDEYGQSRLPVWKKAALLVCQSASDESLYRPSLEAATKAMGLLFAEPELLIAGSLGRDDAAAQSPDLARRARSLGMRLVSTECQDKVNRSLRS